VSLELSPNQQEVFRMGLRLHPSRKELRLQKVLTGLLLDHQAVLRLELCLHRSQRP
jgi:hypothetical protein